MIKSMTGFGRGHFEDEALAFTVEIKSINHRFLDLHIKLPAELSGLEFKIRRLVQSHVKRGRVDLNVNIDRNQSAGFSLNVTLLQAYFNAVEQIRRDFSISGELELVQLLRIPGIINVESMKVSGKSMERVVEGATTAVLTALEDLNHMRIEEGKALRADILKRLATIREEVQRIKEQAQDTITAYRDR